MPEAPNSQRLAIIPGTTVPEVIPLDVPILPLRLVPFRIEGGWINLLNVPVARRLYAQFASLSQNSRVFGLKQLGFAHSEESYRQMKWRILSFLMGLPQRRLKDLPREEIVLLAEGRMLDIIADSQGGFPAVRFAREFPELVGHLVLLSVPLLGTPAAEWVAALVRRIGLDRYVDIAGLDCMAEDSDYVKQIRSDLEWVLDLPTGPMVWTISSGHDFLVPWRSAYFLVPEDSPYNGRHPRIQRKRLHHKRHSLLGDTIDHVASRSGVLRMHITEIFLRDTGAYMAQVLATPSRPIAQAVTSLPATKAA